MHSRFRGIWCRVALVNAGLLVLVLAAGSMGHLTHAALNSTEARFPVGNSPFFVGVGDLNGDGFPDAVATNFNSGTASVLYGDGSGLLGPQTAYATDAGPFGVAAGYVNADGMVDLVVGNFSSATITVLLNNGAGFSAAGSVSVGSNPFGIAAGDINGDGNADVVTGNSGSSDVSILLSNGDGTFTPSSQSPMILGISPSAVALAHLDSDGILDLLVVNESSSDLSVLPGLGGGLFGPDTRYPLQVNAESIDLGDLDADGDEDVAVANFTSRTISILLGNGDGTLTPHGSYATGGPSASVAIGDVDGDGIPDLVVAGQSFVAPRPSILNVLPGNGDGSFDSPVVLKTDRGYTAADVMDLDGNGRNDIAASRIVPPPPSTPTGGEIVVMLFNAAPVASMSAAATTECTAREGTDVFLDGTGSTDDQGIVSYEWIEDLGEPTETLLGTDASMTASLVLGSHDITLRVTDAFGESDTASAVVSIVDTIAPTITASANPPNLWPPSGAYVDIVVDVVASDTCGLLPVSLTSIVSSEADPDAVQEADFGTPDFNFKLQSEKIAQTRVYTITYTASDVSGNSTDAVTTVQVRRLKTKTRL